MSIYLIFEFIGKSILKGFIYGVCISGVLISLPSVHKLSFDYVTNIRRTELLNNNTKNFYIDSYIDFNVLIKFKNFMHNVNDDDNVYIYLKTNGGLFSSTQAICNILLRHKGSTHSIIDNYSLSGGTFCALCCKHIYANKLSIFSPVDAMYNSDNKFTQLSSVDTIFNKKNPDKISDDTYLLNDHAIKIENNIKECFNKIANLHNYNETIKQKIYDELFAGKKYDHNTHFLTEDLKSLGINIQPLTQEMQKFASLTNDY